jgi:hypothetical protein
MLLTRDPVSLVGVVVDHKYSLGGVPLTGDRAAGLARLVASLRTTLHHRRQQLRDQGKALEVGPDNPLTQQAFVNQR